MDKKFRIFGYGSLINYESLISTSPSATNIFPARLYGFIRVFNIKDTKFVEDSSKPKCVLNIEKSEYNQFINGVCFEVDLDGLEKLKEREEGYELISVEVCSLCEEKKICKAFTFRVPHYEAFDYQFDSLDQKKYLDMCLDGCMGISYDFLLEFKETTYIGRNTLRDLDF